MAWSKEETLKLIDIWARADIQVQLEACHRNRDVYQKIAKELREEGGCTNRTYEQCREKVKKLKGDYRKVKDKQHKTGEERNDWEYFEAMDSVLGHKPATHPPLVIDTSAKENVVTVKSVDASSDDKVQLDSKTTDPSVAATTIVKKENKTTNKRSATDCHIESFQNVLTNVLDKLIDCQNKSEARLLEFEEKKAEIRQRTETAGKR